MAEERFDPAEPLTPLSERDLAPIEPLTAPKILGIGQKYIEASFNHQRLGRKLEASTEAVDDDLPDMMILAGGRLQAFKEVLTLLGQDRLISIIDRQINQFFDQT